MSINTQTLTIKGLRPSFSLDDLESYMKKTLPNKVYEMFDFFKVWFDSDTNELVVKGFIGGVRLKPFALLSDLSETRIKVKEVSPRKGGREYDGNEVDFFTIVFIELDQTPSNYIDKKWL